MKRFRFITVILTLLVLGLVMSLSFALPIKIKNRNEIDIKLIEADSNNVKIERNGVILTVPRAQFESPVSVWTDLTQKSLYAGDTEKAYGYAQQILIWDPLNVQAQFIVDKVDAIVAEQKRIEQARQEEIEAKDRYAAVREQVTREVKRNLELQAMTPEKILTKVKETYQAMSTYNIKLKSVVDIKANGVSQTMEIPTAITGMKPDFMKIDIQIPYMDSQIYIQSTSALVYMPKTKQYIRLAESELKSVLPNNNMSGGVENMFNGLNQYEALAGLASKAKVLRRESIDFDGKSVECFVIQIDAPALPQGTAAEIGQMYYWIGVESSLVLKQEMSMSVKNSSGEIPVKQSILTESIESNIPMEKSTFEFAPPADAKQLDIAKMLQGLMQMNAGGAKAAK